MDTPTYTADVTIGGVNQVTLSAIGNALPRVIITRQSGSLVLTAYAADGTTPFDLTSLTGLDAKVKPYNSSTAEVTLGTGVISGGNNNIYTVTWTKDTIPAGWSTFNPLDKDGAIVLYVEFEETGTADYYQWATRFNVEDGTFTGDAATLPLVSLIFYYNPTYYYSNTTTDADPGAGYFRFDSTTISSVANIYVADENEQGVNMSAYLQSLNSGNRLVFSNPNVKLESVLFTVSGTPTNATGYTKIPVTYVDAGTTPFTDASPFAINIDSGIQNSFADGSSLNDDNGNELIEFGVTASAVNHVKVTNAATGNAPSITTVGDDTPDIDLTIDPKGAGETLVNGRVKIIHTATEADDHSLEIDTNAAGIGDVKSVDLAYTTGAIASGSDEAVMLVNIDENSATGGDVTALEVLTTTTGSTDGINGMLIGAGINPVEQLSGSFGNADSVLVIAVDQTTALSSGGAGNISVFVADNDTMTIGKASKFEEIEFILDTVATGSGIAPTFEYSTGVGTWATFTPVDGTNGMRNNGVIAWLDGDIPSWAVGTGSEYLIKITRTRNSLGTTPILDLVQVVAATQYFWDKTAVLKIAEIHGVTNFITTDGTDTTKKASHDLSAITTATTRTITYPDANVNLGLVASALQNVVEDTTPQLGGALDCQTNGLTNTGSIAGATTITATGTGTFGQVNINDTSAIAEMYMDRDTGVAVTNGTFINAIYARGYNGSSNTTGGYIGFRGNGTWSGSSYATGFVIANVPAGSTSATVNLEIGEDGTADFQSNNIASINTITIEETSAPSTPASGDAVAYIKTDRSVCLLDATGNERKFVNAMPEATLTDGASITWNLYNAINAKVTLGGNRTLSNVLNPREGYFTLKVIQDGTGSRTLAYGASYLFAGGTTPTLTTTAGATDLLYFYGDGTNMILLSTVLDVQ